MALNNQNMKSSLQGFTREDNLIRCETLEVGERLVASEDSNVCDDDCLHDAKASV